MSGFDYNHFSKDFSYRTRNNLKFITKITERLLEDPKQFDINDDLFSYRGQDREKVREKKLTRWENGTLDLIRDPHYKTYEVTQLLLSMYGMLIIPYEKYKKNSESKDDLPQALTRTANYASIKQKIKEIKLAGRYRNTYNNANDESVYQFIRHLRNAVSHEGIHFLPLMSGQTEEIEEIIFYDFIAEESDNRGNKLRYTFNESPQKFCVKLYVKELKDFIEQITGMYSQISECFDIDDEKRYKQALKECNDFLGGN